INGDSKLDLISIYGESVAILTGDGTGAFGSGASATFSLPSPQLDWVALGDFNGDGKPDIVATDRDQFSVLINSTFQTAIGPNSTAVVGQTDFTFDNVTAGGTTSVTSIDPATAGDIPGGFAVADVAFEVSTTASFSGSVTSCFSIPSVNAESDFLNLRVLHKEGEVLVDRTVSHNFPNRKICATTTSFSPFYLARVGKSVKLLFDRGKAFKSGSTIPVKLQIIDEAGQNGSSALLTLTARGLRRIGSVTSNDITDAGDSNSDYNFRYDSGIQGYIFNLKTKGLTPGKYVLSLYAGTDRTFLYTVTFDVK
ncbi:MAG: FG-GAP-like repeat-containing protein, partial [bacterium]|nr:FG-GAP-like repeat-containing protein [bacterium]